MSWSERSWWTAAGLMLLVWSFRLLGWVSSYPVVTVAVVIAGLWGLTTIAAVWVVGRRPRRRRAAVWPVLTLAVSVVVFGIWCLLQVYQAPGYGTDELAFDQYAAQLLTHGIDPYTRSMAPAFAHFHVQPDGYTFRLDGTAVTTLSYPALAFLPYALFLVMGLSTQLAVGLNVVAWAAAIVAVFFLLPRAIRPMAIVIGGISVYVAYAVGGVTVALFVPLLAGAAYHWHRFPDQRGWRAWRGPALLGLAMCINQVPWFVLPFLVLGVGLEAGRRRGARAGGAAGARYLAITLGVFAVPNIAFLVWDAAAWARGILVPLVAPTVPAGQGLVAFSLYLDAGGGYLRLYTLLSGVTLVVLLAAYAVTYPRLRPVALLLPAFVLALATRSYGSYLVGLVPAALVGALTARATTGAGRVWPHWRPVVAGGSVLVAGAAVAALVTPSPLTLTIEDVRTTGQLATVEQVTVAVHNRSGHAVTPHFTVSSGDAVTAFWLPTGGPRTLPAGAAATYTLLSPNFFAQPPVDGGFQVVALTSSPPSLSHSGAYLPTTLHLALVPDAVDHTVAVGQAVTVRAEVLDRFDRPVRRAGIPVYLGQIVYAQEGLRYGEAIINDGQPGQTPVSALTDPAGVATFTIRGTVPGADPVYFEANLVDTRRFYPYGYSEILPIRFRG